jgi:hypothetical protein
MDSTLLPAPLVDPRESLLDPVLPDGSRRSRRGRGDGRMPPPPASVLREPVRLLAPTVENPFAPGREVAFARVSGTLLEPLGVRDGDHVALARRDEAEHGDLAAVLGGDGVAGLWKVYPEGESLRLTTGDPIWSRRTNGRPRITGVVVGVLRKFAE